MNAKSDLAIQITSLWEKGSWDELQQQSMDAFETEPCRADLALFLASAHFHHVDLVMTRACLQQARDWGATSAQAAEILFAGSANTMGRIALAAGMDADAEAHFTAAVAPGSVGTQTSDKGFVRRLHQMAQLGLLPKAGRVLGEQYAKEVAQGVRNETRLGILETGIEQLQHELSLALKKNQLGRRASDDKLATDPVGFARAHSVSQLGQDFWVLEQTNFKTGGFFVEFGATNGILLSNTYLLETAFGWSGLCAEPNPQFFAKLEQNRTCKVSNACISDRTGRVVEFILADVFGGFAEHMDHDQHAAKRRDYVDSGAVSRLTTISLHDFLVQHKAPKKIDYLSIDTEGSEFEILAAFPFDKWDISLLTVEHNFTPAREKIFELLSGHGYVREKREWDDWYYRAAPEKRRKPPSKRTRKQTKTDKAKSA